MSGMMRRLEAVRHIQIHYGRDRREQSNARHLLADGENGARPLPHATPEEALAMKPPRIALAWFPQQTFSTLRAAQVDADEIPATWEEWRKQIVDRLGKRGLTLEDVVRIDLDLDKLKAFCAMQSLRPDANGQALFAAWTSAKREADERNRHEP